MTHTRTLSFPVAAIVVATVVASACTDSPGSAVDDAPGGAATVDDPALVPIPAVTDADDPVATTAPPTVSAARRPSIALIDADGQLGLIDSGTVRNDWFKFDAFPSPDRSTAVMTLGPHITGIGPERPVVWVSLPDGVQLADQTMRTDSELTATSLDGAFAAVTTRAGNPVEGAIAGARRTSEIEIISRDHGPVFRQTLDGNFEPEAFSDRSTAAGIPAQIFLLEYFPADAPRFYRVRVLSTETGEVSLPLNLRNKSQQVDERMAGFSRSQVVAEDHGLLFTLYRGTIDGTPDGEPYAFVHTLDFADGVWCLEVDPSLELERLPGSLAVGGDRLYVASANGMIGSFRIPSITDPDMSPSMDWVAPFSREVDDAPAVAADGGGVWVDPDDGASRLIRIDDAGRRRDPVGLPSSGASAIAIGPDGDVAAIGDDWATFEIGPRPDWLGEIAHLVVGD